MATNVCMQNCTESGGFLYDMVSEELWSPWSEHFIYRPWLFSLLGSTMVGLTGIFPLLVIPIDEGADLKTGASAGTLKTLLSFAVGGLLGDVFLHLLPEAWENDRLKTAEDAGHPSLGCGLYVLSGFLIFVIAEKIFAFDNSDEEEETSKEIDVLEDSQHQQLEKEMENNNCITLVGTSPKNGLTKRLVKADYSKVMTEAQALLEKKNGYTPMANGFKDLAKNGFTKPVLTCNMVPNGNLKDHSFQELKDCLSKSETKNGLVNGYRTKSLPSNIKVAEEPKEKKKHITGYLNLLANVIDNFTHGLAVGGSFLVSLRLGTLTTFAILIHEIPHEVGDFAILLRSGFNRWDAARAQILTASGGILGAMCAVFFSGGGVEARTSWILPFTAGGFLHIGMVTILPELLKETNPKESLKQLVALIFGIAVMALLTILCD